MRITTVVATIATTLVPAFFVPARAISVPETMARTIRLDGAVSPRAGSTHRLAFPATHIAFSWSGSEKARFLYRTAEGWREAPIAHDADTERRHYTGVVSVDRLTELDWRVEADPGVSVSDITVDYLNTMDGPRVTTEIPATAAAAANEPDIVTRAEWGADESLKRTSGGCERQFHPLQQIFVHHTAGSNFDENPKATMRAIYWYHVVRQGWCDIGYNFVVSYDGRIFEGRWARDYAPWEAHDSENKAGKVVSGAHVDGYNSGALGISVMGNFDTAEPSPATRRSVAELIAWKVDRHDLQARGSHDYRNPESGDVRHLPWVAGHRDADTTACPGDNLYSSLRSIRRDAEAVMGAGKASTTVTVAASATRIGYGETVSITGTLTDADGIPLAAREIRTYAREGEQEWAAGPTTTTAADGTFAFTAQPNANLSFAAIYDGDSATWGDEGEVRVRVRPVVTLVAENAVAGSDGTFVYPPGTSEIPLAGDVTPSHVGYEVEVKISKLDAEGAFVRIDSVPAELRRGGAFSVSWPVDDPVTGGTYQATAVLPKHDDHIRAKSAPVTFVVQPQP